MWCSLNVFIYTNLASIFLVRDVSSIIKFAFITISKAIRHFEGFHQSPRSGVSTNDKNVMAR